MRDLSLASLTPFEGYISQFTWLHPSSTSNKSSSLWCSGVRAVLGFSWHQIIRMSDKEWIVSRICFNIYLTPYSSTKCIVQTFQRRKIYWMISISNHIQNPACEIASQISSRRKRTSLPWDSFRLAFLFRGVNLASMEERYASQFYAPSKMNSAVMQRKAS